MPTKSPTLAALARDLAAGATTSRQLVEDCLARIDDPAGEGARTFVSVAHEAARRSAGAMDDLRRAGAAPSPFAGIPLAIKDLFDIAGEVTTAGSTALAGRPAASHDAAAVARLRQAGFVVIGRASMTEFAYSGLGLNPHYGDPRAPFERSVGRASGGSTSGGAVAVADGMAHGALGTDTGGSCRIPAAFCGIVGYKPTARRVPQQGCVPLSPSLDSIGPLARSVACCAALDAVLAGDAAAPVVPLGPAGLRLAVPTTVVLDDLGPEVAAAFEQALAALERAGALVSRIAVPEFAEVGAMNAKGGLAAAESYAWHRGLIAEAGASYDPRVLSRIEKGAAQSAADYLDLLAARRGLIARVEARFATYDAIVMPTVASLPPRIADLATDEAFGRANARALRNASLINLIDGCAISLPVAAAGGAPVGLTIAGLARADHKVFAMAAAVEAFLAG
ncbi:amidase [Chelatococcus reniformis]|uniref:Amidase n=1 Tax=Chelatococcus reniformis TaxID=1494448 RepID=A0A916XC35_9HYPH|nr:amidase [Chelatococcus reniformis]GGC60845.1 amidase [Chelatococcus reniformis]